MLLIRDSLEIDSCIQTESEGMQKDIPCNRNKKKSGVAMLISDKTDFKMKNVQRRTLRNYKGVNARRGYNNHEYLYTQHRSI